MKWNANQATTAIVLLCAGFVALSFFRNGGGSCALLPYESCPAVAPTMISEWTLRDLSDTRHHASDYAGTAKVLIFWATWCVNCRREMPEFIALHNEIRPRGGQVLGIDLEDGPLQPVVEYANALGLNFPIFRLEEPQAQSIAASVRSVPTTLVLAPDGTVLKRYEGAINQTEIVGLLAPFLSADEPETATRD